MSSGAAAAAADCPLWDTILSTSFPQHASASTEELAKPHTLYPDVSYTDADRDTIRDYLTIAPRLCSPGEDAAKGDERLGRLNAHLATRTTLVGAKPSVADVAVYSRVAPAVKGWSDEQRTGERGYHHITRWVDFVENSALFGLKVPADQKVNMDSDKVISPVKQLDPKAEKARLKKEKEEAAAAAAATAGPTGAAPSDSKPPLVTRLADGTVKLPTHNKMRLTKGPTGEMMVAPPAAAAESTPSEAGAPTPAAAAAAAAPANTKKKEKAPKQPKPPKNKPAEDKPLSPSLIDLRVGHILKAERHPNADSLYVSTVCVGDPAGTDNTAEFEGKVCRTVCSGLNGLVPLEEMQGRKVVAVCNLKPVTMRGIKSCAMVLAASPKQQEGEDGHGGPVELVEVPAASEAGERVYFEGWRDGEPEAVLNPKKKVWETCQAGFVTTAEREVGFDAGAVKELQQQQQQQQEGGMTTKTTGVGLLRTEQGLCWVKSLTGATVR